MLSSRLLMSEARLFSDCEVKKLVGLSRAELTLLPVARSFWVVASSAAVDCKERRFWRTDAERTIPDIAVTFLVLSNAFRPFRPDYPGNVRASHLTKHESDTENSAKCLKNNAKNAFFTIRPTAQAIDRIEYFLKAISRLRLVNSDSGRGDTATIVQSPSLARCERLIAQIRSSTGDSGEQAWR